MLAIDSLISDLRSALDETTPALAVMEVLARTCSQPDAVRAALPVDRAVLTPIHRSPELTVLHVVWAPGMALPPHNHLMWACIGIYTGAEDNTYWRRTPTGIEARGGTTLRDGDSVVHGDAIIHSVVNPNGHTATGAIHVYGGDYFATPRSLWNAETREEGPADGAVLQQLFVEANDRWHPSN